MKSHHFFGLPVMLTFFIVAFVGDLAAQSPCPASNWCTDTYVFCLSELNGISCNNDQWGPAGCKPKCAKLSGSTYSFSNWYAFVSGGGTVTITMSYGACVDNDNDPAHADGIAWALYPDCSCSNELFCSNDGDPVPNNQTFQGVLVPCKVYYLWFCGQETAICDFTLSVSGTDPVLDPLGFINNEPSGLIEHCSSNCPFTLFINKTGACLPTTYRWTLNGSPIGGGLNEVQIGFLPKGDYTVCVEAWAGNPDNGSNCGHEGPRCATLRISDLPDAIGVSRTICYGGTWHFQKIYNSGIYKESFTDKNCCFYDSVVTFTVIDVPEVNGPARNLCWEDANPNGYKWGTQLIYNSGSYKERFKIGDCFVDSVVNFTVLDVAVIVGVPRTICWEQSHPKGFQWHNQVVTTSGTYKERFKNVHCWYDSAVDFTVLDVPVEPEVFYITCDNEPYKDILGRTYLPCKNQYKISLPKTTDPFHCDSSIRLTFITVNFSTPQWKTRCIQGQIEIAPNISLLKQCFVGETYQFEYNWYKKNDPNKATLSTDESILVDPVDEDYCLDMNVRVNLGNITSVCSKTFCESIKEGEFAPKCFPLVGDQLICLNSIGSYRIDTIINQKVVNYYWTIAGGYIVSNINAPGIDVKWLLHSGEIGTVCVYYETDCGRSCEKCVEVIFKDSPKPYAGPNDSICSLIDKFQGKKDLGGFWSQVSGAGKSIIKDSTDPTSDVIVDKFGLYTFVYQETKGGCTSTDTVDLYFNANPDTSALIYRCNSQKTQYKLRFLIQGGIPPYTIVQGNGSIDIDNYFNSDYYDNLTNYTIVIRDEMGCELSFNFNHECNCSNAVYGFDKTIENRCGDQFFTFTAPQFVLNADDTLIYVVTTNPDPDIAASGLFIKMLTSTPMFFDANYMSYNTTYYIIVLIGKKNRQGGIDFLADCVQADGPKPFTFYQIPSPDAGIDDIICGDLYNLKGTQSIVGSNIKWKLVSGNGVNIVDDVAASTSVNTNGQYGTYIFELTEDNHGCAVSDRVSITFNSVPFLAVDQKTCLEQVPPFRYHATIKITNGQSPFIIIQGGGSIAGTIYTTDSIASATQFNAQIKDANGCISNLIIDSHDCMCSSIDAGHLDTSLVEVCVDQCVSIRNLIGETKSPEDAVIFVLHQSTYNETNPAFPKIDTFYSANDLICFHPNQMTPGRTYYITRVVGDSTIANGKKIVKDNDPCKRVTKNQPIIWYDYPTPDAGPSDSVCFYNYQLKGIVKTGTPVWKFLSGPGQSNIANANNNITNVIVNGKGTYIYELTEDFKGCISKDTVSITYWDSPNFFNSGIPECDNTAEHYRVTVDGQNGDRPSWSIASYSSPTGPLSGSFIGPNTWQTDWLPNNDIYNLILNDRHNCLPDTISNTYECPCINKIGNLDKTPIILCIDQIANSVYSVNSGNPDANDVIRYVLFEGNPADLKSGNYLNFNTNGNFKFDPAKMQAGKTYYIAVLMGNVDPSDLDKILLNDRCLKYDVVPVIWYDLPIAKITGSDTLTCKQTTIVLDGNSSISGSGTPLKYQWSTINGNIISNSTISNITINLSGTYKLIVTDPITKCTDENSFIVNRTVVNPILNIATPQMLTCDRTSVMLDATASSKGTDYKLQWTGPGTITKGNSYTPSVDATGIYQLIIVNQNTGCMDSITVKVLGDYNKPIPQVKQIGQLICNNNQVQLDASGSKGQSGPINSYSWKTTSGNIIGNKNTSTIAIDKPGIYEVIVKDQSNGCDSIASIQVVEIPNPIVGFDVNAQDPKCFGEQNGVMEINGVISNLPLNGFQYSFNNSPFSVNTLFPNLGQGTYQLKVKDNNGCEHDTIVSLIAPDKMGIHVIKSIIVDIDSPVNLDSMILGVTGGTKNYKDTSWLNINQNIDWPNVQYLADTTRDFLITVIDASGCMIQERVKVIVRTVRDVWWPSAFSPNGDGINDIWNIKGKRIDNIRTLSIYDRWGEVVYLAQNIRDGNVDPNSGWNGEFNGRKVLPGVYVFYAEIEYIGSFVLDKVKGELNLIR